MKNKNYKKLSNNQIIRSNMSQKFYKIGAFKTFSKENFSKFTRKHVCQNLVFNNIVSWKNSQFSQGSTCARFLFLIKVLARDDGLRRKFNFKGDKDLCLKSTRSEIPLINWTISLQWKTFLFSFLRFKTYLIHLLIDFIILQNLLS